jgi:hypothetical protein
MSEQTASKQQSQRSAQHVGQFEVEVACKNSNPWRSVVLGETFRGRWSRHNLGAASASVSSSMSQMPDIPGIRMKITPKDRKVYIYDPLSKDKRTLERITATCRNAMIGFNTEFRAKDAVEKTLDDDRFVTLLMELYKSATKKNPSIVCVSGTIPTPEEIASLPGRELYDPGYQYKGKPKYVGDEDKYAHVVRALEEKGITL